MTSTDITTALLAKIDRIVENTDATRKDFGEYQRTNDARVVKLETALEELTSRLSECEAKLTQSNAVHPECSLSDGDREVFKQQLLKNHVCISGIPSLNNENPAVIAKAVFDAIGVTTDITSAYRTKPSRITSGLIVVKLPSFESKLEVLKAKKLKRTLSIQHVNIGAKGNSLVYINHQLTPYFSSLSFKAKLAIKEGLLLSRWLTGNGLNIKLPDGHVHTIKSEAELNSLTQNVVPKRVISNVTDPVEDSDECIVVENENTATNAEGYVDEPIITTNSKNQHKMHKRKMNDVDDEASHELSKSKRPATKCTKPKTNISN